MRAPDSPSAVRAPCSTFSKRAEAPRTRGTKSTTYEYGFGSKLTKVVSNFPGQVADIGYTYGGDGKRRWRTDAGAITDIYNWDAGFNVINEEDSAGVLKKTYVTEFVGRPTISPGNPRSNILVDSGVVGVALAEVDTATPSTGTWSYYTHDNIRSTRGLFDDNAAKVGELGYSPFGDLIFSETSGDVSRLFAGLDYDSNTGDYYSPYRYYDPLIVRWLTRDPLGSVDGPNVFAYVISNPIDNNDPMGLKCGTGFLNSISIQDKVFGADFGPCCSRHDSCYAGDNYLTGPLTREQCDRMFRTCMYKACSNIRGPLRRGVCYAVASAYYFLVRILGWAAYDKTNRYSCGK